MCPDLCSYMTKKKNQLSEVIVLYLLQFCLFGFCGKENHLSGSDPERGTSWYDLGHRRNATHMDIFHSMPLFRQEVQPHSQRLQLP